MKKELYLATLVSRLRTVLAIVAIVFSIVSFFVVPISFAEDVSWWFAWISIGVSLISVLLWIVLPDLEVWEYYKENYIQGKLAAIKQASEWLKYNDEHFNGSLEDFIVDFEKDMYKNI